MNNAELIVNYLNYLGIEYAFGVPGGAIEPFLDALAKSERKNGIKAFITKHETEAVFMADGYAKHSGKIGVCFATTGPGVTNLITGITSSFFDKTPIIVITPQCKLGDFGKGSFQDSSSYGVDTVSMLKFCTNYSDLVSSGEQVKTKMNKAIMESSITKKGPTHLSIPVDILREESCFSSEQILINEKQPNLIPNNESIEKLNELISSSNKITIVLGERAEQSINTINNHILKCNWNVVTTPTGKGLFPNNNLYKGVIGMAGHKSAQEILKEENSDLVIFVGDDLNEINTFGWNENFVISERLVVISSEPSDLEQSEKSILNVLGDIEYIFSKINTIKLINDSNILYKDDTEITSPHKKGLCKPQEFFPILNSIIPTDTKIFFDTGCSYLWGIHLWKTKEVFNNSKFKTGIRYSSMGWSIGSAIGAHLATKKPTVCVTGDGSILMNGQEIMTAKENNLNVLFIVLNDSGYGMVRSGQRLANAERIGTEFDYFDFCKLADAMSVDSKKIESCNDLLNLDIEEIFSKDKPFILEIMVDPDEIPPLGMRMKTLGTG